MYYYGLPIHKLRRNLVGINLNESLALVSVPIPLLKGLHLRRNQNLVQGQKLNIRLSYPHDVM